MLSISTTAPLSSSKIVPLFISQAFANRWQEFSSKFRVWKQEDAKRLIAHYIATYLQVERARKAMLLDEVKEEVPTFFQEIRRQLVQVRGRVGR